MANRPPSPCCRARAAHVLFHEAYRPGLPGWRSHRYGPPCDRQDPHGDQRSTMPNGPRPIEQFPFANQKLAPQSARVQTSKNAQTKPVKSTQLDANPRSRVKNAVWAGKARTPRASRNAGTNLSAIPSQPARRLDAPAPFSNFASIAFGVPAFHRFVQSPAATAPIPAGLAAPPGRGYRSRWAVPA